MRTQVGFALLLCCGSVAATASANERATQGAKMAGLVRNDGQIGMLGRAVTQGKARALNLDNNLYGAAIAHVRTANPSVTIEDVDRTARVAKRRLPNVTRKGNLVVFTTMNGAAKNYVVETSKDGRALTGRMWAQPSNRDRRTPGTKAPLLTRLGIGLASGIMTASLLGRDRLQIIKAALEERVAATE